MADPPSSSASSGPVFANLVLADEINRATPKTQSALLEAMQERRSPCSARPRAARAVPGARHRRTRSSMEGTYPLPEAQLDRFLFKLSGPSTSPSMRA
jgi:MoxR-like ATPase